MAVCPAGEEVIGAYWQDKPTFIKRVVRPLQETIETLYVVAGSDAEAHAAKRFSHKRLMRVKNGLRPTSIRGFLFGLSPNYSRSLHAETPAEVTGERPFEAW